jgi:nuclear pore complex protein Nup93
VDEEEDGGLRGLADVLLGYGEGISMDLQANRDQRGVWAGVSIDVRTI